MGNVPSGGVYFTLKIEKTKKNFKYSKRKEIEEKYEISKTAKISLN